MHIYHQLTPSFVQFCPLDFKQVLSENAQKYAKIAAVALAIFAAAAAVFYLVKWMNAVNLDGSPDLANEHDSFAADKEKIIERVGDYAFDDAQAIKDAAEKAEREAEKRLMEEAEKFFKAQQANIVPAHPVNEDDEWMIAYQIVEEAEAAEALAREQALEKERVRFGRPLPPPPSPRINNPIGNIPAEDNLQPYAVELAGQIDIIVRTLATPDKKKVNNLRNLAVFLKTNQHKQEIIDYCKASSQPQYQNSLYQSYTGSFKTLCDFFKDKDFPLEKKMEVLERFQAERHICVPGRVALLNDICNSMDEPVGVAEKLPWLIARYKIEILRAVIKEVHSLNTVIIKHGIEFGLPASVISAAKADLHIPAFAGYVPQNYMQTYRSSCTAAGCVDFLEDYINSDLPGRGAYRSHILGILADQVTDEQVDDEKEQAFIKKTHKAALKNEEKAEKKGISKNIETIPTLPKPKLSGKKSWRKIDFKKDPLY